MTATRTLAGTLALLCLGTLACGESEPTPSKADDRATSPAPSAVAMAADPPAGAAAATPAVLVDCLVQADVIVLGPYERDVAEGVTVESLELSVTDRAEAEPNKGSLYLFADATAATTYADAARALAVQDEEVDPTATAAVHGTTVLVVDRPPVASAQEQALLGCLPDADPATVVAPPAPGTASLGSLLGCAAAAGLHSRAEHTYVDEMQGRIGRVTLQTPSSFGGYDDRAYVSVYADAATAESHEAELTGDDEPGSFTRNGNTIAQFFGAIDAGDPTTALVLGCLPA